MEEENLEGRIAAYLDEHMPGARNVIVSGLSRIYGGSSQQTYRYHAAWDEGGEKHEGDYILRRDAAAGLVVAERDLEFTVYSALSDQPLPLPRVHFLELDPTWLDRPFFIMDLCPGRPGNPFEPNDPYEGHDETVARDFWTHLGTLAAIDHRTAGLQGLRNGDAVGSFWQAELDRWEGILDEGETVIEPIVRGAIRWLRRNPPPEAAKPAIVHGDYRSGNFLFTPEDGRVSALLDWEMCHIGDPLEDIAWAIDPFWPITRHMPLDEGLAIWEQASGLKVDRAALDWWRLFACVKACAIWTTAEASVASGDSYEMIVALSGIRAGHFHRKQALAQMKALGAIA